MNKQTWKKFVGVLVLASASTVLAVACGDDDAAKTCSSTQVLAAAAGGGEVCYETCTTGVCAVGSKCNSQQICIPNAVGTNNTSTNNASTNNASTNNASTNNASTNNASTNNASTNNSTNNNTTNPTCTPSTVTGACDPLCQTGCAPTQACVASGNPPVSSCQAAGVGVQGATCNNMMGCAVGFACFVASSTATSGTCREFCKPGAATCDAGLECGAIVQDMSLGVCAAKVDQCTVVPNNCPANEMCYATNLGLQCRPYSATAMVGDACAAANECGNNQGCIGMQGAGTTCALLCDPANNTCPNAKACNGLTDENGNPLGYGACAI